MLSRGEVGSKLDPEMDTFKGVNHTVNLHFRTVNICYFLKHSC